MKQFTLELRNALAELGEQDIVVKAKEPEFVEFAGKKLKVGKYGRAKGYAKAFLLVDPDAQVYYLNKHGELSKRLTEKAFLTHWDAGMSTFLGEI